MSACRVDTLGDAGDFAAFVMSAGVPAYDAYYSHNLNVFGYPLYHTIYDGFTLYDSFMDPHYKVGKCNASNWNRVVLSYLVFL